MLDTFLGEEAQDGGGPRRKIFRLFAEEVKSKMCITVINALIMHIYHGNLYTIKELFHKFNSKPEDHFNDDFDLLSHWSKSSYQVIAPFAIDILGAL